MRKNWDGRIPYSKHSGGMLQYISDLPSAYNDPDIEWRPNGVFPATLEFVEIRRGRSACEAIWKYAGFKYPMFMNHLEELLRKKRFHRGQVTGIWTFCKMGQNFGIRLADEDRTVRED